MLRDDTVSFAKYHSFLCLHGIIGNQRISQLDAYTHLFSWISNMNGTSLPSPAAINFWCKGERFVNNSILETTFTASEIAFSKYSNAWQYLLEHNDIECPEVLITQLKDAVSNDLINDNVLYDKNNDVYRNDFDILAVAIIEALANDRARKRVKIDMELMNKLNEQDKYCLHNNLELKTPYVLHALLSSQNSVLFKVLEHVRKGLGEKITEKMRKYVSEESHSGSHQGWSVSESKFLLYAKKYALKKGLNIAGEEEIIRGLMLDETKTILMIFSSCGGKETFYKALNEYPHRITSDIVTSD